MKSKRSDDEKQAIIDRYLSGEKISYLLQENGIPRSTLYSWIKAYKDRPTKKQPKLTVRGANYRSKSFNDYLKSWMLNTLFQEHTFLTTIL